MPRLILDENFDAADGATWPAGRWKTTNAGGTATVQGRKGRIATGTSAFGDARLLLQMLIPRDFEMYLEVTTPASVATDGFFINIRSPSPAMTFWTFANCYEWRLVATGFWQWFKVTGGTEVAQGSAGGPVSGNTTYGIRIRAVGNFMRSKIFDVASYEPGWDPLLDLRDSTYTGNWFSIAGYSSDATASVNFDFDTIKIWDLTKRLNTEG